MFSAVLTKMALLVVEYPLESFVFRNRGRMVSAQVIVKIAQLLQSMKLTEGWLIGLISRSAAAPIKPKTDKRNMCMVRVK